MISAVAAALLLLDQTLSAGLAYTSSGLAALALAAVTLGSKPRAWLRRTVLVNASILTVLLIALGVAGAAVAGCGRQFYFMAMSSTFVVILALAAYTYAHMSSPRPLIGPAASRWAVVLLTAALVVAAFGFDLYSTVLGAPTNRSAGFFAEPSHLALYGLVAWGFAWLHRPNRTLVVISLAVTFYFAFSLTLVLLLVAWFGFAILFRLVRPVTLAAVTAPLAVAAVLATQATSLITEGPLANVARYVDSRVSGVLASDQSGAPNLSSVVMLRGIDLARASVLQSAGLGLGLGNMGCSDTVNHSSAWNAVLAAYGLPDLNLRDGSILGAKLVSELGLVGAALVVGFVLACGLLATRLRARRMRHEAAIACALLFTLLFVRALPYFAIPTVIAAFVLARCWVTREGTGGARAPLTDPQAAASGHDATRLTDPPGTRTMTPKTDSRRRPVIVISAVNLVEGGTLSILSDCLAWVDDVLTDRYEVVALVHRASMFDCRSVQLIEMPRAKRSWLCRIWHEYRLFKPLSLSLRPVLWLSLHDMTPNVVAERRAVYCHNPSPFYRISPREAWHEPTLLLFNLFYRYMYRINIRHNDFVIVQQQWLKREFERLFALPHIIVAHPQIPESIYRAAHGPSALAPKPGQVTRLIYPAFPRAFKNFEVLAEALLEYSQRGQWGLEVLITVDGTENRYARWLRARYGKVEGLRFIGRVPRAELFSLYTEVDAMVFPSKLETWGLPLTEFKAFGKPILAADLPYARETVGAYDRCAYFAAKDHRTLAELMIDLRNGRLRYAAPSSPDQCQVTGWEALFGILLARNDQ